MQISLVFISLTYTTLSFTERLLAIRAPKNITTKWTSLAIGGSNEDLTWTVLYHKIIQPFRPMRNINLQNFISSQATKIRAITPQDLFCERATKSPAM